MNYTFYFISIAGFFVAGSCAIFVLARNPENRLNRLFFLFAASVALFDLTDAMMNIAGTRATAEFYHHFSAFFWLIYLPLFLHFCLIFSGLIRTMSARILVFLMYVSTIIMTCLSIFTDLIFESVQMSLFGYHGTIGKYYLVLSAYSFIAVMLPAIVLRYAWMASKEKRKKDIAFILFIGLLTIIPIGALFDLILPFFGYYVHSSIPTMTTMFVLIFAYVMAKFGLLLVSPARLANDILATMPDMMVFIDNIKYINMVNEKVISELGYAKEEFLGRPVKDIFSEDTDCDALYGTVRQKGSVRNEKLILRKKNGELIPVTMDATVSRDRLGDEIGCVMIFRNISETENLLAIQKQTSEQLTAQVTELEKLNRLTMEREDRIIELKNKIKELEERLGSK